jgi:hypothetical protein
MKLLRASRRVEARFAAATQEPDSTAPLPDNS